VKIPVLPLERTVTGDAPSDRQLISMFIEIASVVYSFIRLFAYLFVCFCVYLYCGLNIYFFILQKKNGWTNYGNTGA
jgi:hypothetical protein